MGKDNTAEPKQLSIRIPWDLRMQLQGAANDHGRSLNSEIVRRLLYTLELDSMAIKPAGATNEKPSVGYVPDDSEMGDAIFSTLSAINQKLDYIASESYANTSFLNLVNYLSRKL